MRKQTLILALAGILSLAAVPAHAFFEANVAGGYTLLNPGALNDLISAAGATDVTKVNGGTYVSLDAGIALLPFLKLDPRVVAVFAGEGKTTFGTTKYTVDGNIVPMELGLAADISIPLSGLSARVGAWGGYGMATVTTVADFGGVKTTSLYQGSAFTAEIVGAFRYSIMPFIALSIEAGYRLANVATLTDTAGNKWQDSSNKDVAYDFSGANVGGGLTFSF